MNSHFALLLNGNDFIQTVPCPPPFYMNTDDFVDFSRSNNITECEIEKIRQICGQFNTKDGSTTSYFTSTYHSPSSTASSESTYHQTSNSTVKSEITTTGTVSVNFTSTIGPTQYTATGTVPMETTVPPIPQPNNIVIGLLVFICIAIALSILTALIVWYTARKRKISYCDVFILVYNYLKELLPSVCDQWKRTDRTYNVSSSSTCNMKNTFYSEQYVYKNKDMDIRIQYHKERHNKSHSSSDTSNEGLDSHLRHNAKDIYTAVTDIESNLYISESMQVNTTETIVHQATIECEVRVENATRISENIYEKPEREEKIISCEKNTGMNDENTNHTIELIHKFKAYENFDSELHIRKSRDQARLNDELVKRISGEEEEGVASR